MSNGWFGSVERSARFLSKLSGATYLELPLAPIGVLLQTLTLRGEYRPDPVLSHKTLVAKLP